MKKKIARASDMIGRANSILVGAGAGLSAAAGLDYSGPAFREAFEDYIQKYDFPDLYTSSFYEFPTEEEKRARWARHVDYARFRPEAFPLYKELLKLIADKNYFVITTNVDGQFIKAGFNPAKVFEVQGDYGLMQCARGCHDKVYPNEALVREMMEKTANFAIPDSLVPHCPVCGGNMDIHVRKNRFFVEDANWHKTAENYENFIKKNIYNNLVLLELGIGFNTPDIIRYPFEAMVYKNAAAFLIRINNMDDYCPERLKKNTIIIRDDIGHAIENILEYIKKVLVFRINKGGNSVGVWE